ncbi:hypothetical protein V8J36_18870 [Frigidibacter sp. MR17.14]|uniref:hypothetical protein n=1 Tax=Frigidibacter sp. MR17.14 TaxID=3126509 RepID=UPI003013119E
MFTFSRITSHKPAVLSKTYAMKNGELVKTTSAQMIEGKVETLSVATPQDFVDTLKALGTAQALVYGTPPTDAPNRVVTTAMLAQGATGIARSNAHFAWPGTGGVLMIDIDPEEGEQAPDRDTLVGLLRRAVPALGEVAMIWFPSSSSHICDAAGRDLTGLRGQRLYVLVDRAAAIPGLGELIAARLWLAGQGRFKISRSGALLDRTVIDTTVWQPSRLDFAAGAHVQGGLTQRRGDPVIVPGDRASLDPERVPALTKDETRQLNALKERTKGPLKEAAAKQRRRWIAELRLADIARFGGAGREAAPVLERAVEKGELFGSFKIIVLRREEGKTRRETVTVKEILADREAFDGLETLDPLEPGYKGGRVIGKLLLDGAPRLHSFARGGRTYSLIARDRVSVPAGDMSDAVDETIARMTGAGTFFRFGTELAHVAMSDFEVMNEHRLTYRLGQIIRYVRPVEARGGTVVPKPIDPPVGLVRQVANLQKTCGLPELTARIDVPVFDASGRMSCAPGYDPDMGYLMADTVAAYADICRTPGKEEIAHAVKTLWAPIAQFPFADDASCSAAFCGLLTAIFRPTLPTAPMLVFEGPDVGVGKTLLAATLGALRLGRRSAVSAALDGDEQEMRKRIFSHLLEGGEVLSIDNAGGHQRSNALAALLTSPLMNDRVLGLSKMSAALPARVLVVMNGKNLTFGEDLARRVLVCRLVPHAGPCDFGFDPVAHVLENRDALIRAAVTLLRARFAAWPDVKGSLASFEDWDLSIGRTLAWLATLSLPKDTTTEKASRKKPVFTDPVPVIRRQGAEGGEAEETEQLLEALCEAFGEESFIAADVARRLVEDGPLQLVLRELMTGGGASAKQLGWHLARFKDRSCGSAEEGRLVLRECHSARKASRRWRIETIAANQPACDQPAAA